MTDYKDAISIPCSNYFADRNGLKPKWIIVHGTAGGSSAQAIGNYFVTTENTSNPVASHYIIGTDGTVVQCVNEKDGAYANGAYSDGHASFWDTSINPNNLTISIEHCKPSTDNSDALTPAQQAASFALINDICNRWNIPKQTATAEGGITGHYSIDPVNRSNCPGPYPWKQLIYSLAANSSSPITSVSPQDDDMKTIELDTDGVSQFFQASANGNWRCKVNQVLLPEPFLSYYKRLGGKDLCGITILGMPLSNPLTPKPNAQYMVFERGVIAYDPQHKLDSAPGNSDACYLMHVDKGLARDTLLNASLASLNKEIVGLNAEIVSTEDKLTAATQANSALSLKVADLEKQSSVATELEAVKAVVTQIQTLASSVK